MSILYKTGCGCICFPFSHESTPQGVVVLKVHDCRGEGDVTFTFDYVSHENWEKRASLPQEEGEKILSRISSLLIKGQALEDVRRILTDGQIS